MIAVRALELFTETGFSAALIHRQRDFQEAKDTAFTLMILRGFVLSIAAFLLAPVVAQYYERADLESMLKVMAVTYLFKGFYNINAIGLEKELDFKRLSFLEQITNVLNFVIVVTLAYYLRNVWSLVIGQVVTNMLGCVLSFVIIPGRPRCRFNKNIARELISYGKFITGLTIVLFVTVEIDNLVAGKVLGMEYLGFYVIAYTLGNMPATHISKVISKVMFPVYSKLQNDLPALRETYLRVLEFIACISIPAAVGIAALAPEIVEVVYGDNWLPAVSILKILCVFGGLRAIGAMNGYVYNALGKPNIPFYLNIVKLLIILVVIYPATVTYGLMGTAASVTIPMIAQFSIGIYIFSRVIALEAAKVYKILSLSIMKSGIMAIVVIAAKNMFGNINIWALLLLVTLGAMSYGLLNVRYIANLGKWREMTLAGGN